MEQDFKKRKRKRRKNKGSSGVAKQRATQNENPSPDHVKQAENITKQTKRRRKRRRKSSPSGLFNDETFNPKNEVFWRNLEPPKKKQRTDTSIEATSAHPAKSNPFSTRVKSPITRDVSSHCQIVERASAYTTLEQCTTETSPLVDISAVTALEVVKSRIVLLQSNIDMCKTRLRNTREEADTLPRTDLRCDTLLKRIDIFEQIIALALENFTELFVQEQWLKDLFDDQSGREESGMKAYEQRATEGFGAMKRAYNERHFPLLQALSPETMACTVEQMIRARSGEGDNDECEDMREEEEGVRGAE